ncbi:MAG: glycosyltransferase [Planctomycetes bacterium]|nr:glycosyltransferase [Planctomycetota bacterium]
MSVLLIHPRPAAPTRRGRPLPPRVTVITTVHNRERYVEAAVRSVRTQTFRDFEHVIVDDASTDASLSILRRLAAEDQRIRLIESRRLGVVGALALAHKHASARLIGWVDSDDLLVQTALEETVGALDANPDAGLVFTDHITIDEAGRPLPDPPRPALAFHAHQLITDFFAFHFRLFRRSVFDAAGGIDESLTAAPDYDFCLRASEHCRFLHLPVPLYCYRRHGSAISTTRRAEQTSNSLLAAERALARRGLADRLRIAVDHNGRFSLVSRTNPQGPS